MAALYAPHRVEHPLGVKRRLCPASVRMLWAVAASVMVHLWMVEHIGAGATRSRLPVPPITLQARLAAAGESLAPATAHPREIRASSAEPEAAAAAPQGWGREAPATGKPARVQPQPSSDAAPGQEQSHVAPAAFDPVYYAARELDVYPMPLAPLRFEYPAHLALAPIAGNVLVTLLVGESGVVDRVAVLAAEPAGYFEEHARVALTSARFHPGRRAGRAVRSQITVSVEYDPAARAAVSR